MSDIAISPVKINRIYRVAVSALFFLQGICFATWASRIPTIQEKLKLSDTSLGMVLFALPVGSMLGLPLAGWLVSRFGSKRICANALLLYSLLLITVGLSQNVTLLVLSLVLFGMAGNISNIAINTQAVGVEAKYSRSIMGSFHGLWSIAGFIAAGIGAFMIGRDIIPSNHFILIGAFILAGVAATFNFLLPNEDRNTSPAKLFALPDAALLKLGIIAFCCLMCEGVMFDWSGIYFQKIVQAPREWVGAGYAAFMLTMASGRFMADKIVNHFGFKTTIQISGLLISLGLIIAILFPNLITAIAGFLIVGFGVSSVVPLIYSQAGKLNSTSPGIALAAVSSIGFLGFLVGPPVIGLVAGFFNLRVSFSIIALIGVIVFFIVRSIKGETNTSPQKDISDE